jgi:hypothetical protein
MIERRGRLGEVLHRAKQILSLWTTRFVRRWRTFQLVPLPVLWKCRRFFDGPGEMRQLIEIARETLAQLCHRGTRGL